MILLVCCKPQEEPLDEWPSTTPVFYASGLIDGRFIKFEAGVNNYEMSSDYKIDSLGVMEFRAKLKNGDCAVCTEQLNITMRNNSAAKTFHADSLFNFSKYDFFDASVTHKEYYDATFISQAKGDGEFEALWDFGNGETASGKQVTTRYFNDGVFNVSHTCTFLNACQSTIQQNIKLQNVYNGYFLDFNYNHINDSMILFNAIPANDSTATINWDFGDGNTASGGIVKHTYASAGSYKVCVSIIKDGQQINHCKHVNTKTYNTCISNFTYKISKVIDALQLANVNIEWIDENGTTYSSAKVKQDASASFKIIDYKQYKPNKRGQPTIQVKLLVNCNVSDGNKIIALNNVQAVVAFVHP